jgi:hypothetical protein
VAQEFDLLDDEANIYKQIGPVLLKQDKTEALMSVNGRLEFIEKEIRRFETQIKGIQDKSEKLKVEVRLIDCCETRGVDKSYRSFRYKTPRNSNSRHKPQHRVLLRSKAIKIPISIRHLDRTQYSHIRTYQNARDWNKNDGLSEADSSQIGRLTRDMTGPHFLTLRHTCLSYSWAGNIDHVFVLTPTGYSRRQSILRHTLVPLIALDSFTTLTHSCNRIEPLSLINHFRF